MVRNAPPDYYAVLDVSSKATAQQIRDAYKRAALKSHPDRVPANSPQRKERTRQFQLVNDAYFILSDTGRRKEYDTQRRLFGVGSQRSAAGSTSSRSSFEDLGADHGDAASEAGSWAWDHFSRAAGSGGQADPKESRKQTEDAQFADVFEEMLREEGMAEPGSNQPTGKFWSLMGSVSGGALGFIVANVAGMVAGAVAGNRLGAVRDAKGKSVYAVFQELPPDDRARMLSQLAVRVFSHVVGA